MYQFHLNEIIRSDILFASIFFNDARKKGFTVIKCRNNMAVTIIAQPFQNSP